MALFFYAFVVIGSFFSVNLFVGVVVDQFGRMKEEFEGSALLTKDQQQWCVPRLRGIPTSIIPIGHDMCGPTGLTTPCARARGCLCCPCVPPVCEGTWW
jgi:hypothetical protein